MLMQLLQEFRTHRGVHWDRRAELYLGHRLPGRYAVFSLGLLVKIPPYALLGSTASIEIEDSTGATAFTAFFEIVNSSAPLLPTHPIDRH